MAAIANFAKLCQVSLFSLIISAILKCKFAKSLVISAMVRKVCSVCAFSVIFSKSRIVDSKLL